MNPPDVALLSLAKQITNLAYFIENCDGEYEGIGIIKKRLLEEAEELLQ